MDLYTRYNSVVGKFKAYELLGATKLKLKLFGAQPRRGMLREAGNNSTRHNTALTLMDGLVSGFMYRRSLKVALDTPLYKQSSLNTSLLLYIRNV